MDNFCGWGFSYNPSSVFRIEAVIGGALCAPRTRRLAQVPRAPRAKQPKSKVY